MVEWTVISAFLPSLHFRWAGCFWNSFTLSSVSFLRDLMRDLSSHLRWFSGRPAIVVFSDRFSVITISHSLIESSMH